MRRNISLKIFSIALVLLFLMAIVALLSTRNVGRVRQEIDEIVKYDTAVTRRLNDINSQALEQEIHLQKLSRLYVSASPDRKAIETEAGTFKERGARIDSLFREAQQLVDTGFQETIVEEQRLEFTRLKPLLKQLQNEHQDYEDYSARMIALLAEGQHQQVEVLRSIFPNEKQEYLAHLAEVREELEDYTQKSVLQAEEHEEQILVANLVITIGAIISGLMFASIITKGLVRPIRELVKGTKAVEQGDLNTQLQVVSQDEIGLLAESFNHMVEQLRVKERIRETFGKYVDPRIVEDLIEKPEVSRADKHVMTVFFSDMENFTTISEGLTPAALVNLINQYFTLMSEPIVRYSGIIDKFLGDAIMAFWGPPFVGESEHAKSACFAALEQFSKLEEFRHMLPELMGLRKGLPVVNIRIGLATGEVLVGNIGSDRAKSYTVMGDTVNLGSRLEGVNKEYKTRILITEETCRRAADAIETREIDSIRVVGKTEPTRIFELLAKKGQLEPATAQMRELFEQGLQAYRNLDFTAARSCFESCLQTHPNDGPSQLFLERIDHFRQAPPPAGWDGVWSILHK